MGAGLTWPLFRLMTFRSTVNVLRISVQKSSSVATSSGARPLTEVVAAESRVLAWRAAAAAANWKKFLRFILAPPRRWLRRCYSNSAGGVKLARSGYVLLLIVSDLYHLLRGARVYDLRSEERRVGKEC